MSQTALAFETSPVDSVLLDRDRFVAFSFCASDVLLEVDDDLDVVFAAGAIPMMTGHDTETYLGNSVIQFFIPSDQILIEELLQRMRQYGRHEEALIRLETTEGPSPFMVLSGYYMPELGGRFYIAMRRHQTKALVISDESMERAEETGLLDGTSFVELASKKLEEMHEMHGDNYRMTTLEFRNADELRNRLDDDRRKEFNATIGATLRANSAGGDMAGDLGEDRYAIVHHKDLDMDALEERIESKARTMDPTGVGIVIEAADVAVGQPGMNDEEATQALIYAIKALENQEGGLNIKDLSNNLSAMVADTARQMREIRTIIEDGSFSTYFQVVVKLRNGEPHHFEALTRFNQHGAQVSPYELIRLAEDVGLVQDFDLTTAQRVLEHLEGKNRTKSDLPIAVNLSGRSLSSPDFIDQFDQLLSHYSGDVRRRLLIEITETVRLKDFEMARNYIGDLRRMGHKVCLDDFGAGEMQIDYLKELEVDFVKIDGSYIKAAQEDPANKMMLKAITSLCRELKVATIAEMVEEEDLVPFLRDCSVMLGQGYLFGKPQPNPVLPKEEEGGWKEMHIKSGKSISKLKKEPTIKRHTGKVADRTEKNFHYDLDSSEVTW